MKHKVTQKTKLHLEKMGKNHVRVLQCVMENLTNEAIIDVATTLDLQNQHVDRIVDDYLAAIDNFWEYA
jgi:hypothetical protein